MRDISIYVQKNSESQIHVSSWINHSSILYFYGINLLCAKLRFSRTSSRLSLVFFSTTVAFWSSLVEDIDSGQGWTTQFVSVSWKRFICYIKWRGDHRSSPLIAIILRSFFLSQETFHDSVSQQYPLILSLSVVLSFFICL